jgi:hypothetical protein
MTDRSVEFEKKRQRELAKERKVHAKRGTPAHAQQKIHVELPAHKTKR